MSVSPLLKNRRWLFAALLPLLYLLIFGFFGGSAIIQSSPAYFRSTIYFILYIPQIGLMLVLLRGSSRGLGKVLSSILIGAAYYVVLSSGNSSITLQLFPVEVIENAISLAVISYLGAIILRHHPWTTELRLMGLIGWRGLLIVLVDSITIIVTAVSVITSNSLPVFLVTLILAFLLNLLLAWKPALLWWRDPSPLTSLFAEVGSGVLVFYLATIAYQGVTTDQTVQATVMGLFASAMALMGLVVMVSALGLLASTGMRFALEYFPTRQRIQQFGLADWRGVVFLSLLGVSFILVVIKFFSPTSISLDAAGPLYAIYMLTMVVLYWQPASRWQQQRQAAYPFAALAILGGLLLFVIITLNLAYTSGATSFFYKVQSILLVYLFYSASACALVAFLPWLRSLWTDRLPAARQSLPLWQVLVGLAVVDYAIVYLAETGSLFYPIAAGTLTLAGAFLLTPRLERLARSLWAAWLAAIVGVFCLTSVLASNEWTQISSSFFQMVKTFSPQSQSDIIGWAAVNITFFVLPLLGALSLAILLHHRIMVRLVLAVSLLAGTQITIILPDRSLDQSGLVTGIAWLAIFGSGWLISDLLPKRVENWVVTFLSGLLLLSLSPLLLPVINDPTDLFSYPVSLPIWSSQQPFSSLNSAVSVFLPILLAVIAGMVFFALMLRSGQAMLQCSRTPRPEIVTLGLLILGACLTLASSYNPTTVYSASLQGDEGWQTIMGGANKKEEPTFLFSDTHKKIWLGGLDGSHAWVMAYNPQVDSVPVELRSTSARGVLQISADADSMVWVLTDQALAAFDQASGQSVVEFSSGQLASELDTAPGEALEFLTFFMDSENTIYVGTSLGLLRLDLDRTGALPTLENVELLPPRTRVTQVGRDSQGHLWAALPDQKKILVALLPEGQMAFRVGAGTGSLEFNLDLSRLQVGTPVALTITAQFPAGVQFIAQAKGQDNLFHCLDGSLASGILPENSQFSTENDAYTQTKAPCLVAGGNPSYAVQIRYVLDDYAGKRTAIQITPWNNETFQGNWLLLGAWVSPATTDGQTAILFSPPDCFAQVDTCVLPHVPQNMGLFNFSSQALVWTDSTGPVYAQAAYDSGSTSPDAGPLVYHHTGLFGLQPLTIQDPVTINRLFLSEQNQALALTSDGLRVLDTQTGVLTVDNYLQILTLYDISAVMFRGDRIWVAGKDPSTNEENPGATYAIYRYTNQEDQDPRDDRWIEIRNVPIGAVQQMALDSRNAIWVLIQDKTYQPNSLWWFILPVMGFFSIGLSEYLRQPPTLARRIRRRLHQQPQQALSILYEVLRTDRTPGLILSLLPASGLSKTDQTWLPLADALIKVAPDQPLPAADQLQAVADTLEKAGPPAGEGLPNGDGVNPPPDQILVEGAAGLGMLYHYLSLAMKASSVMQIAAWPLRVLRNQENLPPMLTSETQQPQPLPEWIDSYTVDTLDVMSSVAAKSKNYQQVDSSQDKLVYLADAVTAAGEALRRADNSQLPERTILRTIALDWIEMVRAELNNFSGRARLRLELRTRQIRRAPQVTLALRLTNTGRAVAEKPAVVLLPGDGYTIPGSDSCTFERISSGGSALAEFTIIPGAEEDARIVCQVRWTDRIRPDNDFQFADKVRFYRQSGEFQRIPNPYIAGNPLKTPDLFRGREDVFQFVAESLSGPVQDRTLVLHGQRRTGKTSVLYQLLNGRLGPKFIPVMIDMQEMAPLINSAADLFAEIAYQIARALNKAGIQADEPQVKDFQSSAVRTFRRFLDKLEDSLGERRVVLLFDEFEILETKIVEGKLDADLLGYFRSLIQHRSGLVFIFTGTHRLEEMSHDYWSVLFNLALYKRISYLSPEETQRLIREPVGSTLTYDELAVEKILNLTHCHPYFTQLICFNLVNLCNEQERNYATLNDVNDAVQEIVVNGEAHFAYIWQRASALERAALAGLAHSLSPGRAWASPREILETLSEGGYTGMEQQPLIEALDGLVGQEVLESTGDGALRYRFQIELIQRWIAANKSVAALAEREK